jgi:methionyl-tRNA formyltransferase
MLRAMTLRAIFMGTPEFAVPCLDALADVAEIVGVVCQPDRPVGRGLVLSAPPVKERALARGLNVIQPEKVRTPEFLQWVRDRNADVALVVAYGRILPKDVLDAPRLGCVNVHASLLPKYRGAAPIAWAIARGERRTGITLMQMDEGMDTGAMLEQLPIDIGDDETAGELSLRLSDLGALAVRRGLPRFARGEYTPVAQAHASATHAPMLEKKDGIIDWSRPARAVHDLVRGMNPWPMAQTTLRGKRIVVHATHPVEGVTGNAGAVVFADKSRVVVACGTDGVELLRVQLEGKKPIRAVEWFGGRGVSEGDVLGA